MRVGFYFNDSGFQNLQLDDPVKGNNGIGGTQYCFLMVADALVKYSDIEVIIYHYNNNVLPCDIEDSIICDQGEILEKAERDKVDIFVFKTEGSTSFVRSLRASKIKTVAWAHNYLFSDELNELYTNSAINRVVFVGKEMYDRYIDHPIISKSTFIYNMFDGRLITSI